MLTVAAFLLALGILVAVHEYGHYRMAVACGVKVLRFSVGFGKVLWTWRSPTSGTEFVLSAFPLGGYVRMLDEREAEVPPEEKHLAFNTQTLFRRAAIVAAGPLANLLLAVVLYAIVNWTGVEQAKAILAPPTQDSVAYEAGLRGGDLVVAAGFAGEETVPVASFDELRWLLARAALEGRDLRLVTRGAGRQAMTERMLKLQGLAVREADAQLFRVIGIVGPLTRPVIGNVLEGGAASRAGIREGDLVRSIGANAVEDGQQLRQMIRASVDGDRPVTGAWVVLRDGVELSISVTPEVHKDPAGLVGKIGAYVGAPPDSVVVHYGVLEGLTRAATQTWDISMLTARMMGKMLVGAVSLKNLSGPLTIADYAGKSASLGLSHFLVFLALVSVSLGVLNLLPLPVLDGGHLMYYLWEGVTGNSVSEKWMERLQRGGIALLMLMMSIALFNDVTRLFG